MRTEIDAVLAGLERPLVGVSALAAGADQIFADAVLAAGGVLDVIVPADDYRITLEPQDRVVFDRLVEAAQSVMTMDYPHSGSGAYLAAGLEMLGRCDRLVAVWDGEAPRGEGGTADMVRRAREQGIPVTVIDAVRAPGD